MRPVMVVQSEQRGLQTCAALFGCRDRDQQLCVNSDHARTLAVQEWNSLYMGMQPVLCSTTRCVLPIDHRKPMWPISSVKDS